MPSVCSKLSSPLCGTFCLGLTVRPALADQKVYADFGFPEDEMFPDPRVFFKEDVEREFQTLCHYFREENTDAGTETGQFDAHVQEMKGKVESAMEQAAI